LRDRHQASIIEFENLQLREGQQPAQDARGDQGVDPGIDILDARVRQHDGGTRRTGRAPTGLQQHGDTVAWCEGVGHAPRQNPAREVVDDGVQIGAGPVEETDDGGVDVPHLVRSCRA